MSTRRLPCTTLRFRRAAFLPIALIFLLAMVTGCTNISSSVSSSGSSAALTFAPTSLTFGTIMQGLSGSVQTLTITSTGSSALSISNIAVTGDFTQTSYGCGIAMATGVTCSVSVTFAPTAVGARTGTLSVTSNASPSVQTVALTGTGGTPLPLLSLSTSALTFPTITEGMSSAPFLITATSVGALPVAISSIAITGDYTQSSSPFGSTCNNATLPTAASCLIAVTFNPSVSGTRTGTLTLTSNVAASPQTITLTGTGAVATASLGQPLQLLVQAGTRPIAGAQVQLYTAGTRGNGSAPTPLLASGATTASGIVAIAGGYICSPPSEPVYAVSRGGTVSGASAANPNIVFATALGPCNAIAAGKTYTIDEATSVAFVEALAQFYAIGGSIGATASNLIGITNAFATAATLADPVAGTSPGSTLPSNASSPAPRIDSLANLLNACAASTAACASLYTATTQGATVPTNTLDALYLLARNPAANVATLYTQSTTSSAYAPVLTKQPTDWTVFLTYSGAGMSSPSGLGVDSNGNVWVSSYFFTASEFTPTGAPVFPGGIVNDGLNNSYGLAIDLGNNVWIPNEQPFTATGIGSVTELSPSGTPLSGASGFVNGGMNYPLSVAIDPNGTVWVVDYGNSHLTLLNSSGSPLSGASGYTTPLFAFPVAVALDANHQGWIVNQSSNYLTKVAPDGSSYTNINCCDLASGIAIDQGDNIWVADYFGDEVSLVTNAGNVISSNYTAGGSIYHPQGIAVDGSGAVWVANFRAPYLVELAGATSKTPGTALSPAAGLGADANLLEAYALSIDASGNIWITNQGANTITRFVGLAVPVKTPLSAIPQLP